MKRITTLITLCVIMITVSIPSLASRPDNSKQTSGQETQAAQSPSPIPVPIDSIKAADSDLRSKIATEMVKEAAKRGLSIKSDQIVYGTRDDAIVANVGVEGIENITEEELAAGADVGLVYISLPPEAGIAKGFYTVKMALTPGTSSGTAQLIDGTGKVAAQLAVQNDVNALIIRIVFTVIIGRNFVCVDFHFRVGRFSISAILCIGWVVVAGN